MLVKKFPLIHLTDTPNAYNKKWDEFNTLEISEFLSNSISLTKVNNSDS